MIKIKKIHDTDWIDSLTDSLENRLSSLNIFILEKFCNKIKQVYEDKKESVDTAKELNIIKNEIKTAFSDCEKEIDNIFNEVAAANIDFANDYYKYKNMPTFESYKQNPTLYKIVKDLKKEYKSMFRNMSQTSVVGFTDNKGEFKPVRNKYIEVINRAVQNVRLDEQSFYTAMRKTVNELSNSGLRTANFESGYTRRLDSQVRMNMQDGIHALNASMQEQVGKEFDADGFEISVHALCAPDHIDIQGQQYSKKEYEDLNKGLKRPIGQLNCRHFAAPIILGVSKPVYSEKELKQFAQKSKEIVEYNGKKYPRYEASQVQRRAETAIRKEREKLKAFETLGDKEQVTRIKSKIKFMTAEYKRFSKAVGLSERMERTRI